MNELKYDPATLELAESYARRGAAFLDKERPGWDDTVDLLSLNLASAHHCVLGQVYRTDATLYAASHGFTFAVPGYDWASTELFCDDTVALVEHGFLSEVETCGCWEECCAIHEEEVEDREMISYPYLDAAWSSLISARRDQWLAYETYAENIAFSGGFEEGYFEGQHSMLGAPVIETVRDIAERLVS